MAMFNSFNCLPGRVPPKTSRPSAEKSAPGHDDAMIHGVRHEDSRAMHRDAYVCCDRW